MTQQIDLSFEYDASLQTLFDALTKEAHFKEWWTSQCTVPAKTGATAVFKWDNYGWAVEMQILKLIPQAGVQWKCTKSNMQNTNAWVGTTLTFKIASVAPNKSTLHFLQGPYPESSCFDICRDGWNFFLGKSLKNYLEKGQGSPYRG